MGTPYFSALSRLESQIVDVLFLLKKASVNDVVRHLPGETKYDTVRITLGILERKGIVNHHKEGNRYIYSPLISADKAKKSALAHVTKTFFGGSTPRAIQALLGISSKELTEEDLNAIEEMIAKAREKAR